MEQDLHRLISQMEHRNNHEKYKHAKITEKVIGCAFRVQREIGGGFAEKVYQRALKIAFENDEIEFAEQLYWPIEFQNRKIAHYYFDFLIEDKVLVEIKSRDELFDKDIAQVLNYMKAKSISVGLIILFGQNRTKIKRLVM